MKGGPTFEARPASERAVDPRILEGLQRIAKNDEEGLLDKAIEVYLENSRRDIETMHRSLVASDAELLSATSHRLKGSAGALGVLALADLCGRLHDLADRHALAECQALMPKIETAHRRADRELREVLSNSDRGVTSCQP